MDARDVAYNMINGKKDNKGRIYSDTSFIFKSTNERIADYVHLLKDRDSILTVIASGDQLINSVLAGAKKVDAFDISMLPKYYAELKRIGLIYLSYEDFISFFFDVDRNNDEKYDDIYYSINKYLGKKYKEFWDYLLSCYDWSEIYNSQLFSSQTITTPSIIEYNPYLRKDNFMKTKSLLQKIDINYIETDIMKFESDKKYDLANLSNIVYYVNGYKDVFDRIKLNDDGTILTYIYELEEFKTAVKDYYFECSFEKFETSNAGVMVYRKNN